MIGKNEVAYSGDFVRDTLSMAFTFLEIRSTAVQLCSINVFVKLSLDTEEFLVGSELIPRGVI